VGCRKPRIGGKHGLDGLFVRGRANPQHEHEWTLFEKIKLEPDKIIIPGVIDTKTNVLEHPELVAQRIERYAGLPAASA